MKIFLTQSHEPFRFSFFLTYLFAFLICFHGYGETDELVPPEITNADLVNVSESSLSTTDAVILGVVEGLTEYLPVSSTGHLILTDHVLDGGEHERNESAKRARYSYLIVIQGGAILAVFIAYWRKLVRILLGLLGKDPEGLKLGLKILVAFIPAALIGPFLDGWIESKLAFPIPIAIALLVGAVVMIVVELWKQKNETDSVEPVPEELDTQADLEKLGFGGALLIGVMQCLAMWPGMSRSMVTIVGGYLVGLRATSAAEFSFLLGFLTLSAASVYKLLGDWEELSSTLEIGPAVIGIIVATLVAFAAVKWFVHFLSKHGLILFAVYRILLAGLIFWLMV